MPFYISPFIFLTEIQSLKRKMRRNKSMIERKFASLGLETSVFVNCFVTAVVAVGFFVVVVVVVVVDVDVVVKSL